MHTKFHTGALLIALLPLSIALIACDTAATADNEVATVAKKKNKSAKTKNKETTNSETKKVAKRDGVTRKLSIARQKVAKSGLAAEYAKIENRNKITKAEQDLVIATTKLQHHEQYTAPNRLARATARFRTKRTTSTPVTSTSSATTMHRWSSAACPMPIKRSTGPSCSTKS